MKRLAPTLALLLVMAGCSAAPAQVVTVTAVPSSSAASPSSEPTRMEFSDQDLADQLAASDFIVSLKVKKKHCFGSAGCNVTFRIDPSFVGSSELPESGEIEVTYKVKGAEDPYTNTFTIDSDGTAHFDSEEDVSTTSSSKRLTAVATDVEWNES